MLRKRRCPETGSLRDCTYASFQNATMNQKGHLFWDMYVVFMNFFISNMTTEGRMYSIVGVSCNNVVSIFLCVAVYILSTSFVFLVASVLTK